MAEPEGSQLVQSWSNLADDLGKRFSEALRNAATLQREFFYNVIDALDVTRGGPGQPAVQKVPQFEEAYRSWMDFTEKAGRRVTDAFVGSVPERAELYKAILPNGKLSPLDGKESERLAKDLAILKDFYEEAMKLLSGSAEEGKPPKPVSPEVAQRLFQFWIESVMKSTESFLRSEAFTRAQGQMLGSALELREKMDANTNVALERFGVPTRKELDEVYKRVTSISRELFDLKRAMLIQVPKAQTGSAGETGV